MANPENSRKDLVAKLSETPKGGRKQILTEAKMTTGYWRARGEKVHSVEDEVPSEDGLGVIVKNKHLYHGSYRDDIKDLTAAEETTVGEGVYFTSEPIRAIGYARERAKLRKDFPVEGYKGKAAAVVYEALAQNLKLLDLRRPENVSRILPEFRTRLREVEQDSKTPWFLQMAMHEAIQQINTGKVGPGSIKLIAVNHPQLFTEYVRSLGYDGLITFEGGDGDVGNHDTYLVFDPEKAKIIQRHEVV